MNCKNCSATIEGYLRVCGLCGHMADRGLPTRGVIGVLVVVALALVGLNLNAMQAKDDGSSRDMKSNWLESMAPAERSHAFSEIGSASCWERVGQYVEFSVVAVYL